MKAMYLALGIILLTSSVKSTYDHEIMKKSTQKIFKSALQCATVDLETKKNLDSLIFYNIDAKEEEYPAEESYIKTLNNCIEQLPDLLNEINSIARENHELEKNLEELGSSLNHFLTFHCKINSNSKNELSSILQKISKCIKTISANESPAENLTLLEKSGNSHEAIERLAKPIFYALHSVVHKKT